MLPADAREYCRILGRLSKRAAVFFGTERKLLQEKDLAGQREPRIGAGVGPGGRSHKHFSHRIRS